MPYKVSIICGAVAAALLASLLIGVETGSGYFEFGTHRRSLQASYLGRHESGAEDNDDESSERTAARNGRPFQCPVAKSGNGRPGAKAWGIRTISSGRSCEATGIGDNRHRTALDSTLRVVRASTRCGASRLKRRHHHCNRQPAASYGNGCGRRVGLQLCQRTPRNKKCQRCNVQGGRRQIRRKGCRGYHRRHGLLPNGVDAAECGSIPIARRHSI